MRQETEDALILRGAECPPDDVDSEGAMEANMDGYGTLRKIPRVLLCIGFAIAAVAAGLALLPAAAPPAFAADEAPSAADQQCLGCHGTAGMEKKLADGDTLLLHVPADMFAKSVHSAIGCAGCHSDIDLAAHPPANKDIESKRSFALTMTQVCRGLSCRQVRPMGDQHSRRAGAQRRSGGAHMHGLP